MKVKADYKKYIITSALVIALHAAAMICFAAGIIMLRGNENYSVGLKRMNEEKYEDSPAFIEQFNQDIKYVFDYIDTRDIFETDGKLDMDKIMFSINDGPSDDIEYSLKQVLALARSGGYVIDENYRIQREPDQENEKLTWQYTINWRSYQNTEFSEPGEQYVTLKQLIEEVLPLLADYSEAHDRLVINPTNFAYTIVYGPRLYSNYENLTYENAATFGRYAVCSSDSIQVITNLKETPVTLQRFAQNSGKNYGGDFRIAVAVDTDYPNEDIYSESNRHYRQQRELYSYGLLGTLIAFVLSVITFIALIILTARYGDRFKDYTIMNAPSQPIETRIFICLLAIIVFLFLNEHVFSKMIHTLLPAGYWEFADKILGYGLIYMCIALLFFSLIKSIKRKNLWSGSLTKRLQDALDRYIGEHSFPARLKLLFILFAAADAVLLVSTVLLILKDKTLTQRIMVLLLIVAFVVLNAAVLYFLEKREVQLDKISAAVDDMAGGKTNTSLNLSEFSGKEKALAEKLNNIGAGLEEAVSGQVRSERLKADLITNVSHDIRTPLTSIINYVDIIKHVDRNDPKVSEYIDILDRKAHHLKNLTDDLLEASKASSGNMTLEMTDIDFVEITQQAVGEFEEKFETKGLTIIPSLPGHAVMINADGRRLWRVLENLFNNAFKYSAEGSRVYVDMKEPGNGEEISALFTIKNMSANPLNISADELTERFVRGDVSRSTEGSGLGLSIARSLTELQGGKFTIDIDGDLFKASVEFPELTDSRRQIPG